MCKILVHHPNIFAADLTGRGVGIFLLLMPQGIGGHLGQPQALEMEQAHRSDYSSRPKFTYNNCDIRSFQFPNIFIIFLTERLCCLSLSVDNLGFSIRGARYRENFEYHI